MYIKCFRCGFEERTDFITEIKICPDCKEKSYVDDITIYDILFDLHKRFDTIIPREIEDLIYGDHVEQKE